MKRIAVLAQLIASALVAVALPASGDPLMFDCITVGSENRCTTGAVGFTVEILDGGDGKAAFVVVNDGPTDLAIAQVYVEDAGGTLVGPPQILNNGPGVGFEWMGKQKQFPDAAGVRPPFKVDADLSVAARQPSAVLGINSGESLGLVYAIAGGLSLGDVIRDLGSGKLRFGVRTVDPSGSARGDRITQSLATEAVD